MLMADAEICTQGGFIRLNNSIGQTIATSGGRKKVIAVMKRLTPKQLQQIKMPLGRR
jgi:hypothetical protein